MIEKLCDIITRNGVNNIQGREKRRNSSAKEGRQEEKGNTKIKKNYGRNTEKKKPKKLCKVMFNVRHSVKVK